MAFPSVTFTFVNGTASDATQVNTNFSDLINGLSDGSKSLNISTCGAVTLTISGSGTVAGTLTAVNLVGSSSISATVYIDIPNGTKAAPGLRGQGLSSNSGLYFKTTDQPCISADGVDVARFRSDGEIDFGVGAEDDDHNTGTSGSDFNYRGQTFRCVSATTTGVTIAALNRSATVDADAVLKAETDVAGGDPYTFWSIGGVGMSMGLDRADGSSLRIVDGTGFPGASTTRARMDGATKSWSFGTDTNTTMAHKFIGASLRMEADVSGGPALQIRSLRTAVGAGEALGALQWYCSDTTLVAAGVAADIRAIETGGTGINYYMTLRSSANGVMVECLRLLETGRALHVNGSTAAPAVSAISDTDTGIQFGGANDLYLCAGGIASIQIFSTTWTPIVQTRIGVSSNFAAPNIVHLNDTNTGLLWGEAKDFYLVSNGTSFFSIASGGALTLGSGTATQHVLNTLLAANGAQVATITNLPAAATAGNPFGWYKMTINGTTSYVPFWH